MQKNYHENTKELKHERDKILGEANALIFLYNILFIIGITIGLPLIIPLVLATDKRRKTVLHRLGLTPLPKAISQNRSQKRDSRPIWIHALSVGEVLSAVPLI
ncbi:MAG: glycosyltransferase N-terminal domain-containing protein, partial [Thermodesulfobacteriota bacterium]|nr:glycosyltransferase N-terminal domain-containing protein [Thermodesulfobacteriota bacterium]